MAGKSRRRLAAAALAAAMSSGLTACTATTGSSGGTKQPLKKEDLVLVASVINTTNPYMASMIEGSKALSEKLGIPLKIVDSQGSSPTEISQRQSTVGDGEEVMRMV